MNQEEEIIFSWNKIKRIFLKYWYIILITFALGAAFVGFKAYKTVAASKAAVNKTVAGSQDTSGNGTANTNKSSSENMLAEDNLSPTGTTYFNITRYVVRFILRLMSLMIIRQRIIIIYSAESTIKAIMKKRF